MRTDDKAVCTGCNYRNAPVDCWECASCSDDGDMRRPRHDHVIPEAELGPLFAAAERTDEPINTSLLWALRMARCYLVHAIQCGCVEGCVRPGSRALEIIDAQIARADAQLEREARDA